MYRLRYLLAALLLASTTTLSANSRLGFLLLESGCQQPAANVAAAQQRSSGGCSDTTAAECFVAANNPLASAFQDLSQFRSDLGGIPAKGGLLPDGGTLARIDTGSTRFYGMNAHGQPTIIGNAFNYTHAEVDALQQAFMAGQLESSATMYVDRGLCSYCRRIDGLPQAVQDFGMSQLTVHDPVNSWLITPKGTIQIPRP
jgi:deoxycytidylate deaminase